ncbi:MAG: hypothetical protein ABJK37_01360 [Paraglaciecola sp.]|uniref:hypothetical protein n=1 Tax=Paraglaciecola sp. TaxID=1920173 RepID=UPI003299388C
MELLTYKNFPRPMRQIASNAWVREVMYRLNVTSVSDLIRLLEAIKGRETKSNSEKASDFWYHVLNKRPVTWTDKINEIEGLFPDTKSILDNLFWHFLLYTRVENVKPKSSQIYNRYMGPSIDDEQLMALTTNYVTNNWDLSLSDDQLETMHSVHGLAALLSGNCQLKYREKNNEQLLLCLYRTFMITFALRYHTDFVWDIFQLLQLHLSNENSPQLPQYFAQIDSKDMLIEKLSFIRNIADKCVAEDQTEETAKTKLIYLARHQNSLELNF